MKYCIMYDDITGEYKYKVSPSFKEAMHWARYHAIETCNHIFVYALRKDGSSGDGQWTIDPWGNAEYN